MNINATRDNEGYLIDPEDWDEDIASELAKEENIELTDISWSVLNIMRDYYDHHKVSPDVRHVIKILADEHGYDKKEAKKIIFNSFPYGYVKQACKIAGMKHPRAWSTG